MKSFIIVSCILLFNKIYADTPDERNVINLTIYNRNLCMISEQRIVNLKEGMNKVDFHYIAPTIFGYTAQVKPTFDNEKLESKLRVISTTYNFDLINQDKMLQVYTGRWFSFTADDATYSGRLLYFDANHLFLQPDTTEPTVLIVERGKLKEMYYPAIPEDFFTRPTLRWEVSADKKFEELPVEISYLANGITWMCDYRGEISKDSIRLTANFTIANDINLAFPKAFITLIAGKPHRSDDPVGGNVNEVKSESNDIMVKELISKTTLLNTKFDEYYRYKLPNPIDLHNGQTVQIPFFLSRKIKFERRYVFPHLLDDRVVRTKIRFKNDKAYWTEPMALPEGDIGLYFRDKDGTITFLGEDKINGTPINGEIELDLGAAFDLTARRVRVAQSRPVRDRQEETWRVEAINSKSEPVVIYVEQRVYGYYNILSAEVDGKPIQPEKDAADRIYFPMVVPAQSSATLTWSIGYGY